MAVALTSKRYRVQDVSDAIEFCFQQGWTDGLPVVPPTPERVSAMLEAARLDPKHQIAFITHRSVSVTAEKVAGNAVIAGCESQYIPVGVGAVEGTRDPPGGVPWPRSPAGSCRGSSSACRARPRGARA